MYMTAHFLTHRLHIYRIGFVPQALIISQVLSFKLLILFLSPIFLYLLFLI
jgi:hypothetical protein